MSARSLADWLDGLAPARAISLWQPWASAVALGLKSVETRGWATAYKGPLVVCASKRKPTLAEFGGSPESYAAAMASAPFGAAVCVVWMAGCQPVESVVRAAWFSESEREWGDYTAGAGRYGFVFSERLRLAQPTPVTGRQGLFALSPAESAEVLLAARDRRSSLITWEGRL